MRLMRDFRPGCGASRRALHIADARHYRAVATKPAHAVDSAFSRGAVDEKTRRASAAGFRCCFSADEWAVIAEMTTSYLPKYAILPHKTTGDEPRAIFRTRPLERERCSRHAEQPHAAAHAARAVFGTHRPMRRRVINMKQYMDDAPAAPRSCCIRFRRDAPIET